MSAHQMDNLMVYVLWDFGTANIIWMELLMDD